MQNLDLWTAQPNKDYVNLRKMYNEVINQYLRYAGHVMMYIGGVYQTPKTVEQEGLVYEYVEKEKQQAAMKFLVDNYIDKDYLIDVAYREFYYHYDALEDNSMFEEVKQCVENMYTNTYLTQSSVAWSNEVEKAFDDIKITKQRSFYK